MKKNYLLLLALVATFQTTLKAQTVTIGTQIWQTTNLNVDTYSDGTPIPQVTDPTTWGNLTTGAWCYYNNDPANGAVYGKLYNWYAAAGIYDAASLTNPALRKNLAPAGWHVPSDAEWSVLINFLDPNANGGNSINVAGGKMKESGIFHWLSPNIGANNSSGFNGIPGGLRYNYGPSAAFGNYCAWWSTTENNTYNYNAYGRYLYYTDSNAVSFFDNMSTGLSIRCVSSQLGIQGHIISRDIYIFPNPTKNTLQLQTATNFTIDKITITDLTGKVILTQTANTHQVDVAALAHGMYIVEAVSGEERFTSKFVKE